MTLRELFVGTGLAILAVLTIIFLFASASPAQAAQRSEPPHFVSDKLYIWSYCTTLDDDMTKPHADMERAKGLMIKWSGEKHRELFMNPKSGCIDFRYFRGTPPRRIELLNRHGEEIVTPEGCFKIWRFKTIAAEPSVPPTLADMAVHNEKIGFTWFFYKCRSA